MSEPAPFGAAWHAWNHRKLAFVGWRWAKRFEQFDAAARFTSAGPIILLLPASIGQRLGLADHVDARRFATPQGERQCSPS